MNILFYTTYEIVPTIGGTERITNSVALELSKNYGHRCYSLFSVSRASKDQSSEIFCESFQLSKHDVNTIANILHQYKIDVIINQGSFGWNPYFRAASEISKCKLVFCHHFSPGWEENFYRKDVLINKLKKKNLKSKAFAAIQLLIYPYLKIYKDRRWPKLYNEVYKSSDWVVLLSLTFKEEWMHYSGIDDDKKFIAIPDMLSFYEYLPIESIKNKKKVVLIVSRLTECQKKISLALDVWKIVKKDKTSNNWVLKILGEGADERKYKEKVRKEEIKDVLFLGRCSPKSYYEEASMFMLTSKSEGWGLTLTEAQQFGCVPIAFDTYSSLGDIISDGQNGFIVAAYDKEQYAAKLIQLMSDKVNRRDLAENAIKSAKRFEPNIIGKKWNELLAKLTNN